MKLIIKASIARVDFRSQPNTLERIGHSRSWPNAPRPSLGSGSAIFPVEGNGGDVFRWVRWPCSARRPAPFPDSAGRSVRRPCFPSEEAGTPASARPLLMSPGVRSRSPSGTSHAVGVQQRRRVLPEHRPQARARASRSRGAAAGQEFTCDMASARSAGASRSNLSPAPLAAASLSRRGFARRRQLLAAAPGAAVEQPRLARPTSPMSAAIARSSEESRRRLSVRTARTRGASRRRRGWPDAPPGRLRRTRRSSPPAAAPAEPAGAVQQREQAGRVLPRALDRVHLPGRGARVLPEGEERGMRPAGGVARGRPARGALPRPVADLAPELHVGHAVVARRDPAVDGRRRQVHRAAVARRHLLGRQPPAQAVPYRLQPGRRGGLVGVYPAPGRDEDRVGAQLRGPGLVEDVGAALAADRAVPAAAVAASRPRARRGRPPTGRREASTRLPRLAFGAVTNLCDATSALTVEGDLPSSLAISCTRPALKHPLTVSSVKCLGCLGSLIYGPPVSCAPPGTVHISVANPRSGPHGIGFPHSSAHVRMNVGGVRMKLIIKASIANAIWFLKYGRIPRQEGKMVPTAAQVVESWAEPLLNEVGSSS